MSKNTIRLMLFLFAAALLLLLGRSLLFHGPGKKVLISQDGVLIHSYSLNETRTEIIPAANGGRNTLHIENGEVWVTDASCPDRLCEHMGHISLPGEIIACLPNRLIVQISEE
ncbi:hypothetical protein EI53_00630 [Fusobacterium naviforme]|uniref:NusG domain-containing protein n=1 Tax=Moryella indoligenes TaxID=371674 RepID=A0AAE3V962_9FIRM|nr:NusG domain II-containing protein [Moryella indoligenes]KAB0578823.1 NusG domain II-containing protein [Fusobacterium naviforme]MDQ0151920.1 hypothetical protein [Moryella indoligenes]PSL11597.1 hypothetical protein EI53_00630 [Fusobacterium naviforme]STO26679.1 Uncharacterized protein conserved in bacteria [Fusobacterium naviforme]